MDIKELFGWKLQQNHCCFSELMRLAKEKLATVSTVQGSRGETLYVFNPIDAEQSCGDSSDCDSQLGSST